MTKQEKIQEAYGDYWEQVKDFMKDDFGTCDNLKMEIGKKMEKNGLPIRWRFLKYFRPVSLDNIETNNGWIKIESENDLPKTGTYDMSSVKLYYFTNNGFYEANDYKKWKTHCDNLEITHFRFEPIFKPEQPIY